MKLLLWKPKRLDSGLLLSQLVFFWLSWIIRWPFIYCALRLIKLIPEQPGIGFQHRGQLRAQPLPPPGGGASTHERFLLFSLLRPLPLSICSQDKSLLCATDWQTWKAWKSRNQRASTTLSFFFLRSTRLTAVLFLEKQQSEPRISQLLRLHSGFPWISPSVADAETDRHLFFFYFCSFTFCSR